jgi:hypothetical protein
VAHDVFISYSMKDKPVADAVCAALEAQGTRCWIAPRDVLPGMDWGGSIINAISQSRVMILIFSSNANKSTQIKREVNQAIEKEVPVIPFRIEDVLPSGSLEYYIDVTHWLDALTPPLEQHLEELAGTVNLLLKKADNQNEPSLARKYALGLEREPTRSRNKSLWIGGGIAVLLLAVLGGMLIGRNGRDHSAQNTNGGIAITPSPTASSTPTTSPNTDSTTLETRPTKPPRPLPNTSDTCIEGYVWREAGPSDHVCVRPEVRARVAQQNILAASRRNPQGGPFGPDTCLQGFVWREAFPGDHVCVSGQEREEVARDNAQAAARVIH